MASINPAEIKTIRAWRKNGVLRDFSSLVSRPEGVVLVACADGDQMADLILHHLKFNQRTHLLTAHGGACVLGCDGREELRRSFLLNDIHDGLAMKAMKTVGVGVHYPCGWARKNHLTVEEQMGLLKCGLRSLQDFLADHGQQDITLIPLLHVDYGSGKKRQYVVKPDTV